MKNKIKDIRVWVNVIAIAFGIAFFDGLLTLGLPEGLYLVLGIAQLVALYKLYKLTK